MNTQAVKCPVCSGTGNVPQGFYYATYIDENGNFCFTSGGIAADRCKSCNGTGYLLITQ